MKKKVLCRISQTYWRLCKSSEGALLGVLLRMSYKPVRRHFAGGRYTVRGKTKGPLFSSMSI